jgi:hypothetical protein
MESEKLTLIDPEDNPLIKRESIWMDHKNPVSGIGGGVLFWIS